jgi:nucleolar protein 16
MANPRQRSKAKSHKSTKPNLNQRKRIHSKLRKAPNLVGPDALQGAWDKKKTVFQK